MASRTAGIPGLGVVLAAAGAYLIYAGVKNVPFVDGLRGLLKGSLPTGTPTEPTQLPDWLNPLAGGDSSTGNGGAAAGGGTALGLKVAMYAKQYQGVPYRWGGNTPAGWDCSGFVTWCLVHNGVGNLPSSRPTAAQYLVWKGATTIPRDQAAAGDLCCWGGHIGIAVSNTDMINAPTAGIPTRIQKIYGGVTIRRINGG